MIHSQIGSMLLLGPVLVLLAITLCLFKSLKRKNEGPPGPRAIPIIGHLHLFAISAKELPPHKLLQGLSQRYGPIMSLQFGSSPVVVASTADAAKEFLRTHDLIFASRPNNALARIVTQYSDLGGAPYGDKWRQLRKLVTVEMLTTSRINMFKEARKKEVKDLCDSVLHAASSASLLDAREAFIAYNFNITTSMLMSKRYFSYGSHNAIDVDEAARFTDFMSKFSKLGAQFPLGDYFPWLKFIDPVESRIKVLAKSLNAFLDANILEREERRKTSSTRGSDFLDVMLDLRDQGEEHLQGPGVRGVMLNVLSGGTDTSASTLEWTLAEMIKHPDVMARAQEELDRVAGRERMVEESDIPHLKYLQAIVKESMRLHFLTPFLLPHQSTESCRVMGYTVAKNTTLLVNAYAISRDPAVWVDPLVFRPERFLESSIDVKGQHFELIPFGAGRRICPGINLAFVTIHLALACLVHMFDWKEADGVEIDNTSEHYGITLTMAKKLQAVPATRLSFTY